MKKKSLLPKKIKIGYQDIKISVQDLHDCQGMYLADDSEIRVKESMDGRETINTVLHECLHACFYTYGIKKILDDDVKEEQIVNALGNAVTELFIRNKSLLDWIADHAKS